MMISLSKSEQETIISFNAAEDEMTIYTADPVWMRRLYKLSEEHPDCYRIKREDKAEGKVISISAIASTKRLLTLRTMIPKAPELTPEQIEERNARLAAYREAQD